MAWITINHFDQLWRSDAKLGGLTSIFVTTIWKFLKLQFIGLAVCILNVFYVTCHIWQWVRSGQCCARDMPAALAMTQLRIGDLIGKLCSASVGRGCIGWFRFICHWMLAAASWSVTWDSLHIWHASSAVLLRLIALTWSAVWRSCLMARKRRVTCVTGEFQRRQHCNCRVTFACRWVSPSHSSFQQMPCVTCARCGLSCTAGASMSTRPDLTKVQNVDTMLAPRHVP